MRINFSLFVSITVFDEKGRRNYGFLFSPRYRFNDRFSLIYSFTFTRQNNNVGWIDFDDDDIFLEPLLFTYFSLKNEIKFSNKILPLYSNQDSMLLFCSKLIVLN